MPPELSGAMAEPVSPAPARRSVGRVVLLTVGPLVGIEIALWIGFHGGR
jgi:hypothetical protein